MTSVDSLAKSYSRGDSYHFKYDTRIPYRYAVSYLFGLSKINARRSKALLGNEVYSKYKELMSDRTPGIPNELVPYTRQVRMYEGVRKKRKNFRQWQDDKKARYLKSRTNNKPLTSHDRDKLVAAAIVDMFFNDRIG